MESFLGHLPLFAGLSAADRAQLEQRMARREFAPQSVMRILDKTNTSLGLDKLISHAPTLALVPEGATLYRGRGRGCTACGGSGVKGRIGIYEVMRMTPALRAMVGRGARAEEIHATALEPGMIDLEGYAALLLLGGQTTVEEVTSVVSIDA